DLDRDTPFLIAGSDDDERAALFGGRELAAEIGADKTLDVDRLLGPVDRPFAEHVTEGTWRLDAVDLRIDGPGQPRLLRLRPVLSGIGSGTTVRFEHERVQALTYDDALEIRLGALLERPGERTACICDAARQGNKLVIAHALEAHLRLCHRSGRRQRGDDEA